MAAKDTKLVATLIVTTKEGKEIEEEARKDLYIRGTVQEIGMDRGRNFLEVGWYDVPPKSKALPVDAISWILDRLNKRLKSSLPKGKKITANSTTEVSGNYKAVNRMQRGITKAIHDTNRLGTYMERRLVKSKKSRRTKKGRGE
jgi:hypothetical protein